MTSSPIVGLLLLCQLCIAIADDVILSIVLHRHGSRGPEAFFPHGIDPNDGLWLDGQGLLTDLGRNQMSALGMALKARYADGFGLIGPQYLREELSVRSTDVDRTLSSAYLVIGSLYPGGTLPVPVHTVSRGDDNLLSYWSANCPQYQSLVTRDRESDDWKNVSTLFAPLLDYLRTGIGISDVNLANIWLAQDPLTCEAGVGYAWPPQFNQSVYQQLSYLYDWTLNRDFHTAEMRLFTSGVFIDLMSQRLSAAGTGTPQPGYDNTVFPAVEVVPGSRKFLGPALYTYSAHDTTIAAVMSGLGVFNSVGAHNPPFASSFVVELVNDTAAGLYVRMFYNEGFNSSSWCDASSQVVMPRCSAVNCPLQEFLKLTASLRLSSSEWTSRCTASEGINREYLRLAAAVLIGSLIGIFIALVVIGVNRCRANRRSYSTSGDVDLELQALTVHSVLPVDGDYAVKS